MRQRAAVRVAEPTVDAEQEHGLELRTGGVNELADFARSRRNTFFDGHLNPGPNRMGAAIIPAS